MCNNILRRVYLYMDSNLPKEGWIQSCLMCGLYISTYYHEETKMYLGNSYKICSYLCDECQERTVKDKNFEKVYFEVYHKKINYLFNKFLK